MTESSSSSAEFARKDTVSQSNSKNRSLDTSIEDLNLVNNEELTPIVTQYKTIVFSEHENSVRVIKEHQYLLNTALLMKEQIKNENDKLKNELKKLIISNPNRLTFIYSCSGNFLIKQPTHLLRKEHELKLSANFRNLKCLETKLTCLELVILEEKARANSRFKARINDQ